jgi:hypothetical protein
MEVRQGEGGRLPETAEAPQLQQVLDEAPVEHPEVLAWIAEAKRLFAEAEERFEAGLVLPALSSLAAVSPLHHMLTERFSCLLMTAVPTEPAEADIAPGLYL